MSNCDKYLSLRMEQLARQWTDLYGHWNSIFFRKYVQKILVSLKPNKNKEYFTWRPIYIMITSLWILLRMRNTPDKNCRKIKTHFTVRIFFKSLLLHMHYGKTKYSVARMPCRREPFLHFLCKIEYLNFDCADVHYVILYYVTSTSWCFHSDLRLVKSNASIYIRTYEQKSRDAVLTFISIKNM